MGTTVTCPTFRYNPAVVAEGFASLSLLYPGRIFLGLGSGEALNEEAAVGYWPKWPERSERLVEATDVIRKLWGGQQVDHAGKYYKVNARLYDPPAQRIPLLMAGNGPKAMRRCGQYADGLITDPKTWKEHKSEFQKRERRTRVKILRRCLCSSNSMSSWAPRKKSRRLRNSGASAPKRGSLLQHSRSKSYSGTGRCGNSFGTSFGGMGYRYRSGHTCEGYFGAIRERRDRRTHPFRTTESKEGN